MTVRRSLPADVKRPSGQQVRRKIKQSSTAEGFKIRPGYLYTVVRAISARVNQNYDGWPAEELKKAAHTFIGKPVFVNHENHDPTLARGRVVASRYVENGADKYIEVVQEIDAERFPRLAHEIRTGGLDSVSMGAEAGFTICSYCNNRATDMAEMCDHVLHHKGEKLRREGKNGQSEDVLVYESCHDVKFFELSYVFDPADETAVVSKVVSASKKDAGKYTKEDFADGKKPWENDDADDDTKTAGVDYGTLRIRARAAARRVARLRQARYEEIGYELSTPEYNKATAQQLIEWFDSRKPQETIYDFMSSHATNPNEVGNARPHVEQMGRVDIYPSLLKQVEALPKAASLRLAFGEIEAPEDIDTLRQEDSDEQDDFQHYLEPPPELQSPDLDASQQLDREQEQEGLDSDRRAEDAEEVQPGQQTMPMAPSQQQQDPRTLTLNLPMPMAGNLTRAWQAAIDDSRPFTAAEERLFEAYINDRPVKIAQDYAQEMNTQQKGHTMGSSLAERGKTASRSQRQHHADLSRNDQGVQEEVFITQTPPEEAVVAPSDDAQNISNTPANLVARIRAASDALKRDLATYQRMTAGRKTAEETPVYADVVDPPLSGTDDQNVTDGSFVSPDPNAGVVPTQPKDASVHAFAAFDRWLSQVAGHRVASLTPASIRRAATRYAKETGTPIEALFPTLGTVLRAARKIEAAGTKTRRDTMNNRTADTSLDVAAPDGRVDVEAPVSNTTDDAAQASQYEVGDYGQNAGDSIADPDLSTTQNFAPGEAPRSAKKADGVLAVRCAEAYINAGLASEGDKWKLAGQFQTMNRGLVQSHVALLERVASVNATKLAKVASGKTRGTARLPQGLTTAPDMVRSASTTRQAFNDPSYDFTLFTS